MAGGGGKGSDERSSGDVWDDGFAMSAVWRNTSLSTMSGVGSFFLSHKEKMGWFFTYPDAYSWKFLRAFAEMELKFIEALPVEWWFGSPVGGRVDWFLCVDAPTVEGDFAGRCLFKNTSGKELIINKWVNFPQDKWWI